MAGTNPIIDLATINDMQTRLAAIEAALGKYNASTAVTAAAATGAAASAGAVPPASADANVTPGANVYQPTQDIIQSGWFELTLNKVQGNFGTGTFTRNFPTVFASPPVVVATAYGVDSSGYARALSVTLGTITGTQFKGRVTNIFGSALFPVRVYWVATTSKQ